MLTLLAPNLVQAVVTLGVMADKLAVMRAGMSGPELISRQYIEVIARSARVVQNAAEAMTLAASVAAARRCAEVVGTAHPSGYWNHNGINALSHSCSGVATVFQDELEAHLVFALSSSAADLVRSDAPLPCGDAVANAFPKASEDISEGAKCLAFGRYTATVFHLMRAMETAVQGLAATLGVANVEKEWGKLLSDIGKAIEAMPRGEERTAWSQAHTHLYHVKQAWRNDTMHPKQTYTEEEAHAIYRAVQSFMAHLARLV